MAQTLKSDKDALLARIQEKQNGEPNASSRIRQAIEQIQRSEALLNNLNSLFERTMDEYNALIRGKDTRQ